MFGASRGDANCKGVQLLAMTTQSRVKVEKTDPSAAAAKIALVHRQAAGKSESLAQRCQTDTPLNSFVTSLQLLSCSKSDPRRFQGETLQKKKPLVEAKWKFQLITRQRVPALFVKLLAISGKVSVQSATAAAITFQVSTRTQGV